METETAEERITADVKHHCKHLGLSYNQTRAAINAALNMWGRVLDAPGTSELHTRTVDDAVQRATSEGRHVAGQFAEVNGHG